MATMAEATITIPSLEEMRKKSSSSCIKVQMNPIELLDYEPWQVIIRIEGDSLVLMKTDDFNQGKKGPVTKISYKDFKSTVQEICG